MLFVSQKSAVHEYLFFKFFLFEGLYKLKAYMRNMIEFEKGFRKMLNFLYNLVLNYTHVNQKSFNIWSETVWSHICLLSPGIEFS